ncbi:MAG TPA: hypothetical protein VHB46_04625 [Burkholderiales bacterium]|nr:hypothetical protein [Burkholderiales bacterium]
MRTSLAVGTSLFVLGVLIGIAELWFAPFSGETFIKVELTIAALIGIVIVVAFVIRESRENRKTRSGDSLD